MFQMGVLEQYWGEAILTVSYHINIMSSRTFAFETSMNMLRKLFPIASHIVSSLTPKVFCHAAFVCNYNHAKSKLDPKALKCIFGGYSPT